jgi:hypothetical protein
MAVDLVDREGIEGEGKARQSCGWDAAEQLSGEQEHRHAAEHKAEPQEDRAGGHGTEHITQADHQPRTREAGHVLHPGESCAVGSVEGVESRGCERKHVMLEHVRDLRDACALIGIEVETRHQAAGIGRQRPGQEDRVGGVDDGHERRGGPTCGAQGLAFGTGALHRPDRARTLGRLRGCFSAGRLPGAREA